MLLLLFSAPLLRETVKDSILQQQSEFINKWCGEPVTVTLTGVQWWYVPHCYIKCLLLPLILLTPTVSDVGTDHSAVAHYDSPPQPLILKLHGSLQPLWSCLTEEAGQHVCVREREALRQMRREWSSQREKPETRAKAKKRERGHQQTRGGEEKRRRGVWS